MRVSTKGRYALHMMLDIAINCKQGAVSIKDIAVRQKISDKYLEQIIAILNGAGFVKGTRGAQGGYRLTKEPREITVGMILRLTEGSISPVACVEGEEHCEKIDKCATIEVWRRIDKAISEVVDNITLEDLIEWNEAAGNSDEESI